MLQNPGFILSSYFPCQMGCLSVEYQPDLIFKSIESTGCVGPTPGATAQEVTGATI